MIGLPPVFPRYIPAGLNVGFRPFATKTPLTMTDVATGWTECTGLLVKDQQVTLRAIMQLRQQFPFDLLGLDTDNGGEFMNYLLWQYCFDENLIFTRSRPYRKNDQCHVEQKNGSVVRRFIGYDRYEGVDPCRILNTLYRQLRLYVNFFQPSFKLTEKKRQGSKVTKKYDRPQTPCQRILAAPKVDAKVKESLLQQFEALDPIDLLARIENLQDALWPYANLASPAGETELPVVGVPKLSRKPLKPDPIPTLAQFDQAKLEPCNRPKRQYRRQQAEPIVRYWRTRKDPFDDVWSEVEQCLETTPNLTAKTLFNWLYEKYPGKFKAGQLLTFQRRIREWRLRSVEKLIDDDLNHE